MFSYPSAAKLHLGHWYNYGPTDSFVRYKKMKGFDTLWLPGMDHAAIATEAKVVQRIKSQGKDKYENMGTNGY